MVKHFWVSFFSNFLSIDLIKIGKLLKQSIIQSIVKRWTERGFEFYRRRTRRYFSFWFVAHLDFSYFAYASFIKVVERGGYLLAESLIKIVLPLARYLTYRYGRSTSLGWIWAWPPISGEEGPKYFV